jgi:hypothetical protein
MNAPILTATMLALALSGALPARAADPQLLNLVMPDARVLAGVNVEQAKGTPFGQYVLTQVQNQNKDMQEVVNLTGFDPTRDVRELLAASTGEPGKKSGLMLARGSFDPAKIASYAASKGAASEVYGGFTILEDPKKTHGVAFLDSTLALAGDVANVKAAIDRRTVAANIPVSLAVQVDQWSNSQDAWFVAAVPAQNLKVPPTAPNLPAITQSTAFQNIQQTAGGVKFGNNVVLTAQAKADTAQNASALADVVRLLVNLAQMQAQQNPQAAALAKSVAVTTDGSQMDVSLTIPGDQFQQMLSHGKAAEGNARQPRPRRPARIM